MQKDWTDVRAAVNSSNLFPVRHSILPISLFDAEIIDFDFAEARVHFYDGRPKRVRRTRKTTIKYTEDQGLIFIPIKINGERGLALIDTGAERSFVNFAYAQQARAIPEFTEQERMRGSDLAPKTARLHTFRDLKFGDFHIPRSKIPALRTDLFQSLGFGDAPMMVMGMDLLAHFRLQVDRERKRVTFLQEADRWTPSDARFHSGRINEFFER